MVLLAGDRVHNIVMLRVENVENLIFERLKALRNKMRDFRQESREEFGALKNRIETRLELATAS